MASAVAGVSAAAARISPSAAPPRKSVFPPAEVKFPKLATRKVLSRRVASTGPATPPEIADRVKESIENAQEACAGDPTSGECIAAWDEVEELSAAASHARDNKKKADPLEEYCKDNPETDECRTYED